MIKRRQALMLASSLLAGHAIGLRAASPDASASSLPLITRPIPSSGEAIPVIGMGTSRTFDKPDEITKGDHTTIEEALQRVEAECGSSDAVNSLLKFAKNSERGLAL